MVQNSIWNEKYRTTNIENFVATNDFKEKIKSYISKNDPPHLIFWGDTGCGKTTIVKLLAKNLECDHLLLNASDENGIDVIREKVKNFASSANFSPLKLVILDEAGNLSSEAQEALNNMIEVYSAKTRFLFTCNRIEKINKPIQSRCVIYNLKPPSEKDVFDTCCKILNSEKINFVNTDVDTVVQIQYPDIRKIISTLQNLSMSGTLIITDEKLTNNNISDIINLVEKKDWKGTRQYILDNDIKDYQLLYKAFYEEWFDKPKIVIILADYQYKQSFSPDKEICFMSCVAKIMDELK